MGQEFPNVFGGLRFGKALKRWQSGRNLPSVAPISDGTRMGAEIGSIRARLDRMAAQARADLRTPHPALAGLDVPDQCDWAMRPAPWCAEMYPDCIADIASPHTLSAGLTLFHDAAEAEISLRQEIAPPERGRVPFGLALEIDHCDGSFVSLVQDLPPEALYGLNRDHFFAVHLRVDRDDPVDLYARLNIEHGPNTEQMVRRIAFTGPRGVAEFDLAYTEINERRLKKGWLDLIIERPDRTRIALWDLVLVRAPRASF